MKYNYIKINTIKYLYGRYTTENSEYIYNNREKMFKVTRHNINYWALPNGMLCHLYDSSIVNIEE